MTAETLRPPGPSRARALKDTLHFLQNDLDFFVDMSRRYGDVMYLPSPLGSFYLFHHPDDIEAILVEHAAKVRKDRFTRYLRHALGNGLVTSEGELWRTQRKLMSSAFTPKRISSYGRVMVEVGERVLASWRGGMEINVHAEMSRIALDVVGRVLFGADLDADVEGVGRAMKHLDEYFANSPELLFQIPSWVPTPRNRRYAKALSTIDEVLMRLLARRRQSGEERDDLLGALLSARDADGTAMTEAQLRDECATLFLAGHETTALALTHALYVLAEHPEVRARFHGELDTVLGGQPPSADHVKALSYTEGILKESMRLYPPVWIIGREVMEPFSVRGFLLPKGAQILLCQWVVHRDPRLYENPETFLPERWEPERAKALPRFAYFPFGGGPRICIGNHFSMMEMVLILALLGQRFHVELLPGQRLVFRPSVTLRPKGPGLQARLVARGSRSETGTSS